MKQWAFNFPARTFHGATKKNESFRSIRSILEFRWNLLLLGMRHTHTNRFSVVFSIYSEQSEFRDFRIFIFCSAPDCCLIWSFLFVCFMHSIRSTFSQKTYHTYIESYTQQQMEKILRCPNVANGKGNTILAQLSIGIRSAAWFGCDSSMKIRFSVEHKSIWGFQWICTFVSRYDILMV